VAVSEVELKVCAEPAVTPVDEPDIVVTAEGVMVKPVTGMASARIVQELPVMYVAAANVAVTPRVPIATLEPVNVAVCVSRPLTVKVATPAMPGVATVIV